MNTNTLLFLIGFGFLFSPKNVLAGDIFSADRSSFIKEMESFLGAKQDKKMAELLSGLESKLEKGGLCDAAFLEMVGVCNQMAELKMPTKSYFGQYFESVIAWNGQCKGKCTFEDWQSVFQKQLKNLSGRNFKPFSNLLTFSKHFFESKTLRYKKGAATWSIDSDDFQITWETDAPVLKVNATRLEAAWKGNSIFIENTSGQYFPLMEKWVGKGGTVKWNRLDPSATAICEFSEYEIDLTAKEYTAQNARLIYPQMFGERQLTGKFSDKLLATLTGPKSSYPRFESEGEWLEIPGVSEGLNYRGGFSLMGLTLVGTAVDGRKAELDVASKDGKPMAKMRANRFKLQKDGPLNADNVEVIIPFGEVDSLCHPAINVKYEPGKKMTLRSGEKAASKSPWYDSFHKVFLFAERVELDLKTGNAFINPKSGGQGGFGQRLYVESENFYDKNLYARIQNVSDKHPLAIVAHMAREEGNTLNASELAVRIHPDFSIQNIQSLLFEMEKFGFVSYDVETKKVEVLSRTFHFVDAAVGKANNDVLRFESSHTQSNATVDVAEGTITLEGIEDFHLHLRPKVAVKPQNGKVVLKENRRAEFDGKVFAGITVLHGKGFDFDYDNFTVSGDSITQFDLYLPTKNMDGNVVFDKNGVPNAEAIGSRIEQTSGTLIVNAPGNRNGAEVLPVFPTLKTDAPAHVYYDLRNEQGKAYPRDSFFFQLEPFTMNHLNSLSPKDFQFKGKMVSAGIFPDFEETLLLQPHDKSLGFTTETSEAGFPAYQKGKFTGEVHLSNSGFKGKGVLNYIATTVQSEDLLFKPRQTTCTAEVFDLEEDFVKSIPKVYGEDVSIDWRPYEDSMFIESKSKSFELFNDGSHQIGGMLIYMPDGLKGRGIFSWEDGEMTSDLFAFGDNSVQTEKTDLQIKAFDTGKLALDTRNLNGKIDFKKKKGRFAANNQTEVTSLPFNDYITTLNEFEWDLGKRSLTFVAPGDKKGFFLSTDGAQDSLQFEGSSATYDFEKGELNVTGVEQILSADAVIIPAEGKVDILPGGAMHKLTGATIMASRRNEYHRISDATVNIDSREHFTAEGFYEINLPDKKQRIHLSDIEGKGNPYGEKTVTTAFAEIKEADDLWLDRRTRFIGDVSLKSSDPSLGFDGFAKLEMAPLKKNEWFEVEFKGDYRNLKIACDEPRNRDGATLHTGLFIDIENAWPYARVLMPEISKRDRQWFKATGMVRFEERFDHFVFGEATRMDEPLGKGNLLYFSNENAEVKAEGTFNICEHVKGIDFRVAGNATTGLSHELLNEPELSKTNLTAHFVSGFDFNLPKALMKIMAEDFNAPVEEVHPVVYSDSEIYTTAISEWVEKPRKRTEAWSKLTHNRLLDLPDDSEPGTFVLGEMGMKWEQSLQSLVLAKQKVALASLGGEGCHRYVDALAEYHMPSNKDDRIYLLLTAPNGQYYFFNYKKGILHVYSSNEAFNVEVREMKDSARQIEVKKGENYELQLTTEDLVRNFKRRVTS